MIKSFRLRIALLSALLTGLALLAFGVSSWWLIRNLKLERIDSEVRTQAERVANRPGRGDNWQGVEARLLNSLGVRDSNELLLLVQDSSGETRYRSGHWPANLDIKQLPWPQQRSAKATVGNDIALITDSQTGLNPLQLPLDRGGADVALPLSRGSWRGFDAFGMLNLISEANALEITTPPTLIAQAYPEHDPEERPHPRPKFGPGHPPPGREFMRDDSPPPPRPLSQQVDTIIQNAPAPTLQPDLARQPPPRPPASLVFSQTNDKHLWRIALATTDSERIAVAVDASIIDADMRSIRNAFFVALPFALTLIGIGSWIFSSRALRPLKKLTTATRRVTAEGLNQRISSEGEDHEFVELIEVYNRMLERLERSFKQAHRFSADAAHELKTPLAILQGQLERAIGQAEDGSPIQAELTTILDEVRRLSTISRKLLLLSQADAGSMNIYREPFDLSKALTDLVEDTHMLAPHLQVSGDIHPGIIPSADVSLLRQVLHNLISNAIKYNIRNGWIKIYTSIQPEKIEVLVANSSEGILPADYDKIFERFYRADPAHSRHVEGVGLGLSVSREISRAHGGDLVLKNSSNGQVQFSLLLPRSAPTNKAISVKKSKTSG
jgi:signal transduction histidine kinase